MNEEAFDFNKLSPKQIEVLKRILRGDDRIRTQWIRFGPRVNQWEDFEL